MVTVETEPKVSRQRAYQLRKIARGLCAICTRKAEPNSERCSVHLKKTRESARKRFGYRKRYHGARSYTKKGEH
jgi:hypothetical protein